MGASGFAVVSWAPSSTVIIATSTSSTMSGSEGFAMLLSCCALAEDTRPSHTGNRQFPQIEQSIVEVVMVGEMTQGYQRARVKGSWERREADAGSSRLNVRLID